MLRFCYVFVLYIFDILNSGHKTIAFSSKKVVLGMDSTIKSLLKVWNDITDKNKYKLYKTYYMSGKKKKTRLFMERNCGLKISPEKIRVVLDFLNLDADKK